MSYLDWPRLHFAGRFQADTSTVNNDVRHYKSDAFLPQFQERMVGQGGGGAQRTNGYWNPEGTGAWRMLGCRITGAATPGGLITSDAKDAVVGMGLAGSDTRVAGKLVDLDPQQQGVSQIWGLRIALQDGRGRRVMESDFGVAPFIDLWKRQQIMQNFDQTLAAAYQSQLVGVRWGDVSASKVLTALKEASARGRLSIRFNVFGFDRDPEAEDYTTGVVVGTIGPAHSGEPRHFVLGRQLVAQLVGGDPAAPTNGDPGAPPNGNPTAPADGVFGLQAVDHADAQVLTADLGNSLPIFQARGDLQDIGALVLAVARDPDVLQGQSVAESDLVSLGAIPYNDPEDPTWYFRSAGIVDLSYADKPEAAALLTDHPLVVARANTNGGYQVLLRETNDGLYVRADDFVHRLNPGEQARIDLYTTRYGRPAPMDVVLGAYNWMFDTSGGTGASLNDERWPIPDVGKPADALQIPSALRTGARGHATLVLKASKEGPGRPRGYLDGQIYGVGYKLKDTPARYNYNPWNFVSVLVWDHHDVPDRPTWFWDIQPIMQQYANLYPIMSRRMVDLGDYDSVVTIVPSLTLTFGLPVTDPNAMPVSRDLSAAKRRMILRWLTLPGPDGLPLRGDPDAAKPAASAPRAVVQAAPTAEHHPAEAGGKLDYVLRTLARPHGTRGGEEC
ncbi:MAG: hypothetical protein H6739_31280 [Alphaproteobacteria bacterium]|nr:hypothetical protein [Alphaproteobacteria bacterium]